MADSGKWQILKVDNDYEIFTEYPHQVRRRRNRRIVSEYSDKTKGGYVRLTLNNKKFYKHRVIAIQFIPNPNNLPEIDHLNAVRTDNRIENLRWSSRSENMNNRSRDSRTGRKIEYVNELPIDNIAVKEFNGFKFNDLYFSNNKFYKWNGINYRIIPLYQDNRGYYNISTRDKDNIRHLIYYTKFKREYGLD